MYNNDGIQYRFLKEKIKLDTIFRYFNNFQLDAFGLRLRWAHIKKIKHQHVFSR